MIYNKQGGDKMDNEFYVDAIIVFRKECPKQKKTDVLKSAEKVLGCRAHKIVKDIYEFRGETYNIAEDVPAFIKANCKYLEEVDYSIYAYELLKNWVYLQSKILDKIIKYE